MTARHKRLLQIYDEENSESIKPGAFCKNQLQQVDIHNDETIESSKVLRDAAALMQSRPDVGIATVEVVLSELPEMGSNSGRSTF